MIGPAMLDFGHAHDQSLTPAPGGSNRPAKGGRDAPCKFSRTKILEQFLPENQKP
jgi:hypothetical protein